MNNNDYCSESEALQDIYDDFDNEGLHEEYERRIKGMRLRYEANKKARVGAAIRCACCGNSMIKKSYQSQFCRNKGRSNCKDTYWNNVDEKRRERAKWV